ncbi:ABC transporter ATP-binding protein [Mesorhizobium sp. M1A.F.Ca.IN.020.06.1.1]|uniref:ABC transporter ATP-binding protein n=1 Tax=unclassified Mesorhizobium TaxID=325217 RepID=UPI000BAE8FAF|nr:MULTISPECIES: ABC transporter ATP-binding protein [unclassified Mesorhizobium]PBB36473.1 ABC transporter ATP-binding protein [Mesorhizobium sp. WSM3882]RUU96320.1 ABC transporter ATP-binding protein [Mesorhizobium sp. M1A.F.Ca.IN.020.03.2.1]RUV83001.1 ABC transporter ATP-binding protein [Mesorhizobium sp. M1A.F.Ca.IN.020.32.1.1]RUW09015.1 ABC transporter ATP-binding protein [Mesorhizobium sp. M1A.F.Ca.IN.022.05.2.1]RUW32679.1 ABC transporter ATP-binding protein [Mesorhizobium sp. M1A.F.Ca.I
MTQIELRGIEKFFGAVQVIHNLNLAIADNEFIVLLGQSGCGKTTTLRAIAGLETIDQGDILIDGKAVQHLKAADRDIAMVFQSFSLYPHMTVFENIAFPLRATRMSSSEVDTSVREIARVLRITDLLDKRPSALSGGDMQRVAIGRALVRRPKAMLMDEPIGALDAKLREEMRAEIKRLHIKQGSTTIYVTHDQIEAMSLADRIVIMHEGFIQQVGTPDEVYSHPANLFVAQFVGSPVMNIAEASVADQAGAASVTVGGAPAGFEFPRELLSRLNGHSNGGLTLGIRPEGVLVRHDAAPGYVPVEAQIIEPLGSFDIVDLKVGSKMLRARTKAGYVSGPAEKVHARIDPEQAHFFDTASGKSLGVRL